MALTEVDRSLLKSLLAHEPGAWKNFVDRFMGLFVHVIQNTAHARSIRVTPEDVDDLCAEVFLTLINGNFGVLRQFRGQSSLATYLTVVSRRVVVREMARRRMAEALGHVHVHGAAIEEQTAAASGMRRIEDADEVRQMLDGLPANEAEIVRQFHLQGRSYHEISSSLGVPENTIGPTLSRARAKLRAPEVQAPLKRTSSQ